MKSRGQRFITKEHIATCNLNFKPALYSNILVSKIIQCLSKPILFLYKPQPTLILNAQYAGATPTFNIEALHLVTNVQLLKCLLQ